MDLLTATHSDLLRATQTVMRWRLARSMVRQMVKLTAKLMVRPTDLASWTAKLTARQMVKLTVTRTATLSLTARLMARLMVTANSTARPMVKPRPTRSLARLRPIRRQMTNSTAMPNLMARLTD